MGRLGNRESLRRNAKLLGSWRIQRGGSRFACSLAVNWLCRSVGGVAALCRSRLCQDPVPHARSDGGGCCARQAVVATWGVLWHVWRRRCAGGCSGMQRVFLQGRREHARAGKGRARPQINPPEARSPPSLAIQVTSSVATRAQNSRDTSQRATTSPLACSQYSGSVSRGASTSATSMPCPIQRGPQRRPRAGQLTTCLPHPLAAPKRSETAPCWRALPHGQAPRTLPYWNAVRMRVRPE